MRDPQYLAGRVRDMRMASLQERALVRTKETDWLFENGLFYTDYAVQVQHHRKWKEKMKDRRMMRMVKPPPTSER